MTRLPVAQVKSLAAGFEVDQPPDVWGVSRVYFDAMADLGKFSPLILAAYEDTVKRKDAGGSDGDEADE